ncbi:hypothetical protein [Chitinophaga rhizophila]|uniref:Uncharacterized protein n=1 Tax=Chitinophaga rhizophila TaxID=2866212 RepID=A0ABS7GIU7_9BACT|nr:hypothetical protein [Chitinophaga rhizophila]MBW8687625.1 hypothetical protein [Chitinophaga rhizophila]
MDIPKHFPPDTGDFISRKEADRLRDNYFKKKHKKHGNEFIQAYFFGKEKLLELLNCQEDIAGLRIYYGDDSDMDGKDDKKMVIYAVDKAGKNILYRKKQQTEVNAFAATAAAKGSVNDEDDGGALDNGLPCPADCP